MSTNANVFDEKVNKFVDLAGLEYFWGKAKGYIDAGDAAVAEDLADLAKKVEDFMGSGEGSVVDQLAALETSLKKYTDDELTAALGAYATTGEDGAEVPATGLRAEIEAKEKALSKAIADVEAAAKSYSIAAVTGDELAALGANVKEAYKLVDEDSVKAGEYIKIYKDSALQSVVLDGQELVFTYLLANGTEDVVRVDVSSFLAESEFKDGLQVVDHVVSVKVDAASEAFLTVGADGVKLSGVQDAINAAANGVSADLAALEAQLYGTTGENATEGDLAKLKAYLEGYADQAETDAVSAAKTYTDALNTKLYGDGTDANKGDLNALETRLMSYADTAEADAVTAANAYTDELFASVKFVTNDDIDGFDWTAPVTE